MAKNRTAMWDRIVKTVLLVSCFASSGVLGYSRGAPDTTCNSLMPGHGLTKQPSASPYTITPSSGTVEGGKRMLVTLEAPVEDPGFKGFLVQARVTDNDEIVGTFFTTDHSYITCGRGFNNAVTHSSPTSKPKVVLEWEAPSDYSGDVVFKGTFVRSYDTYWVGVTSEKVTVTQPAATPTATPTITTPTTTTTTTTTTATTTTTEISNFVSPPVDGISPQNASDAVINIVDAPGLDVDVPVENDTGVVINGDEGSVPTPTLVSSPPSPTSPSISSTADSSSNTISQGDTDSPGSSDDSSSSSSNSSSSTESVTKSTVGRTTPRRRFGLLGGRLRPTTPGTTKATTTTTDSPATTEASAPSVPSENLPPEIASLHHAMQNVYLGCESNKGCFGFPAGCESKENCDMLATYSKVSSGYLFEIMGTVGSSGYVAVGLSDDDKMGTDSVMACTSLNGETEVLMAYNNEVKTNEILANSKYGLTDIKTAQVDGRVYCSFIRQTITEIKNINFNLAGDRFHLMLARGPAGPNQLRYHDKRAVSSSTSSLEEFAALEATSELFVTLHACFMIGAWVCAASCGILLARYYKQTWLKNKCCGIDQWFHLHRFFMAMTWSLTIAGFVLIVYYKQGWTDNPLSRNPHPIIGVIATGLCFIQPFMALCRCNPNHKNRSVFNWLHWFVGNSAQILGLTAIFYGFDLIGAPTWTWFILIIFIAFHCVMHLILSVGQCVSDSKADKSNNVFPMKEMNGSRNPLHPVEKRVDAPGGTFRKAMLAIYLIVTWLITAVLIVIVVFGEEQLRKWNILFWEK